MGSPLDSLRVAIYSNSSGSPGSSLASVEVDAFDLPGDPTWAWFRLAGSGLSVTAGTYWIVVERTGSVSGSNYYRLGMTTTGSGSCKAYTGSTWTDNPTGASMPFKVWYAEETTAIIEDITNSVGEVIRAVRIVDDSGVWVNPQEDGDNSAYDVIDKLIELGASATAQGSFGK